MTLIATDPSGPSACWTTPYLYHVNQILEILKNYVPAPDFQIEISEICQIGLT